MKYKSLSIIIPVYNEEKLVVKTVDIVWKSNTLGLKKEIIIVNDGSTDKTANNILKDLTLRAKNAKKKLKKNKAINSISLDTKDVTCVFIDKKKNAGKGAAVKTGFINSTGDLVVIQDADLEYDPNELQRILIPFLEHNADVVYGSRFISDRPHRVLYFWHSIGNRFLTLLSNMFTNLNLTDMETGCKMFKGNLIRSIAPKLESKRFGFEPEITSRISRIKELQMFELGISYWGRTYEEGKKIGWRDGLQAIYVIIKYGIRRKL